MSRRSIAVVKFVVLAGWGLVLIVLLPPGYIVAGLLARVGSLDGVDLVPRLARLLTALLAFTIGFVASVGKGYLPALGAKILLVVITQIAVLFGTGGWFPYATPGLYALAGANGIPEASPLRLLLVPVTIGIVAWLTVRWWSERKWHDGQGTPTPPEMSQTSPGCRPDTPAGISLLADWWT